MRIGPTLLTAAVTASLLAAVSACAPAPPSDDTRPPPDSVRIVVDEDAVDALCMTSHFALSPNGQFIASWVGRHELPPLYDRLDSGSAVIMPAECIGEGAGCAAWRLSQFELFDRVVWRSNSQEVFVFDRDRWVRRLVLADLDRPHATIPYRDSARLPVGLSDRLTIYGPTDSRSARSEKDRLTAASLGPIFLQYEGRLVHGMRPENAAFDRQGFVGALVSDARFTYHALLPPNPSVVGPIFPRALANFAAPVRQLDGAVALSAAGSILSISRDATVRPLLPDDGYLRPVIDAETGVSLGVRNERGVRLDPFASDVAWFGDYVQSALAETTLYTIHDLQIARTSGVALLVLLHLEDGLEVRLARRGGGRVSAQTLACGNYGFTPPRTLRELASMHSARRDRSRPPDATASPPLTRTFRDLGDSDFRLSAREIAGSDETKGVIVFAHGGPAGSLERDAYRHRLLELAELGYRVIAVDYSGSSGAGYSVKERLPRLGPAALHRDAALVAGLIEAQRHEQVVIYAESFGSTFAAALVETRPDLIDAVVLIAPWLQYRHASAWGARRRLDERDIAHQAASDQLSLLSRPSGGGQNLAEWMRAATADWPTSLPTLLVFGELDPLSQIEDWPARGPQVQVLSLSGANHESAGLSSETRARVREFLDRLPPGQ